MSLLKLSIYLRRICYFNIFILNWPMDKWWMVKWCNVEIKNRTGRLFSHKYWICLYVLVLNTTFLLIIKNKQTSIRYCNTSSFVVVFFETVRLKNYVNILSNIATLSPLASHRRFRCWHLIVVVGVLGLAPSCWSQRHLFVVAVLSLSAVASLLVDSSVGFCASF